MASKPNLIIIGASKSSTTTLYTLLRHHPEVWLPGKKGAYYFTSADYGTDAAWKNYQRLFRGAPERARIIGESSNTYSMLPRHDAVSRRIRDTLDDVKLIYMVRDPVSRAVSHFRHKYLGGGKKYATSLADALEKDPLLIAQSCYAMQIKPYLELFGQDSVLVVVAERLHKNPTGEMRRVEEFLGLRPFEWSAEHIPRVNQFEELRQSVGWQKLFGPNLFPQIRSITPAFLRRLIKPLGPKPDPPPPFTDQETERLYGRVREDLKEFYEMMGEAIEQWPSIQRLICEENLECHIQSAKR